MPEIEKPSPSWTGDGLGDTIMGAQKLLSYFTPTDISNKIIQIRIFFVT